ncbi:DUF1772 domain-containing protein [Acuticoccus sp. M5D2P5]|uniref:anthrone oxygenase family protein n=1 Tax=Acuticoccus kalidii TaxID=2910977 RepID=UPI001F1D1D60|nr:anthrone oxygenase family protein [Acuticoccus kalidii]MCF3933111.1 DUF1772 domain-containing protein [Acuticoccus kalidii]
MVPLVTLIAALGAALMAGTFFVFSVAVMGAFATLPPAGGIAAMQAINRVIQNALFLGVFLGTAVISLALLVAALLGAAPLGTTGAGAIAYLAATLITIAGNVPLNDRLDRIDGTAPDAAPFWATYRRRWTALNHIRTVACLLATVFFILSFAAR